MSTTYIGIDICSKHLDICRQGQFEQIPFNQKSVDKFIKSLLDENKLIQLVFESTGELSLRFISWIDNKIPYSCLNPYRVRQFAVGCGIIAKTDIKDCYVLELYGQKVNPQPNFKLSKTQLQIKIYNTTLKFLIREVAKFKTKLKTASDAFSVKMLKEAMLPMELRIKKLQDKIKELILTDQLLSKIFNQLIQVRGIADRAAIAIIAHMPEIGTLSRTQVASLLGVCPYDWSSGNMKSTKRIKTGRKDLRDVLHMCIIAATIHNPVIKQFYIQLKIKGKSTRCAQVACMRKMIIHLNSITKKVLDDENLSSIQKTTGQ